MIIETRKLRRENVRKLCIQKGWYTCGTNEQYSKMLDFAHDNVMTTENLIFVAKDIISHTSDERFKDCVPNAITPLEYVLYELADISNTYFDEKEDTAV